MSRIKKEIKNIFESSQDRASDISFFEEALTEFDSGNQIKGIYAKALSLSEGDESKVKAKYLELRVEILKDKKKEKDRRQRMAEQENKQRDEYESSLNHKKEEKESVIKFENENKEILEEELEGSLNFVSRVIGVYSVIGKILVFIYVIILLLGDGDELLFILLYGIALLIPYIFVNFLLKSKKYYSLKDQKKHIAKLYIVTIISSIFISIIGWIVGLYLLHKLIKLNKRFKY